jgi:hypothetical protein
VNVATFTTVGLLVIAAALLGWRRDHRKRVKGEAMMVRTVSERFSREWIPLNIVRAWESWN